jgi:hypothetical protein
VVSNLQVVEMGDEFFELPSDERDELPVPPVLIDDGRLMSHQRPLWCGRCRRP